MLPFRFERQMPGDLCFQPDCCQEMVSVPLPKVPLYCPRQVPVRLYWPGGAALVVEAAEVVEVAAFGVAVRDRVWPSKAIAKTTTATAVATPSAPIVASRFGRSCLRAGDRGP